MDVSAVVIRRPRIHEARAAPDGQTIWNQPTGLAIRFWRPTGLR